MKHTIRGKKSTECAVLPQDRGKMVQFHIFQFSLYLKNIIIYAYISWSNTCIDIFIRFLPNIMIIGWIFLKRHQFFFSHAILPRLPLNVTPISSLIFLIQIDIFSSNMDMYDWYCVYLFLAWYRNYKWIYDLFQYWNDFLTQTSSGCWCKDRMPDKVTVYMENYLLNL